VTVAADSGTKPTDIMNRQNAELFIVKSDGSYRYHRVLKVFMQACQPTKRNKRLTVTAIILHTLST
jgi:hypothetical protein